LPPPNRGVAQVATVGEEMFAAADRLFIGLHIVSNREIEQNLIISEWAVTQLLAII
jgi:hypothetical protein